jgi:hypothetical protein
MGKVTFQEIQTAVVHEITLVTNAYCGGKSSSRSAGSSIPIPTRVTRA